jgi:hypothetical protein
MHIAICRLLEPYGFYEFEFLMRKDGHIIKLEELPPLKQGTISFNEGSYCKLFC